MSSCTQKDHTHMHCQLASRILFLSSFNGWKWSNMLNLPSTMPLGTHGMATHYHFTLKCTASG